MKHTLLLLVVLLTSSLYAQGIEVNGVVSDNKGEPIIGVTVLVQGTQDGTITDFDGNFSLSVAEGAMLQFTYVGYKEVVLPAKAIMSVLMQEDKDGSESQRICLHPIGRNARPAKGVCLTIIVALPNTSTLTYLSSSDESTCV